MAEVTATGFSWAKVLYSGLLVGVIFLLIGELNRLWFDRTLHVGTFQLFENGEEKPALGRAFSMQVLNHHRTLSYLLKQEALRRSGRSSQSAGGNQSEVGSQPMQENTWWPKEVLPVTDPKSALSDLELSVQGINVKQILTSLRQWVSTPNEIFGVIEKGATVVRGTASWPNGPARARGDLIDGRLFEVNGQADTSRAAFQVGCALIWAQAAAAQRDLADAGSADFCDWAEAWVEFVSLRDKASRIESLTSADIDRVKQLQVYLTRLLQHPLPYPEVYRLRADLIELLPGAQKSDGDLALAQDDRTNYSIRTDPEKRKLPADIVKFVALAEARPAIPFEADAAAQFSDTWRTILSPHVDSILAAARASGLLRVMVDKQVREAMTAFVVAPRVIATVGFALPQDIRRGPFPQRLDGPIRLEFSFADQNASNGPLKEPIAVEEILYASPKPRANALFALLRLAEHDIAAHPPLTLEHQREKLESLVGRYVFTVGFANEDRNVPRQFLERLLNGRYDIKRTMPGRVVSTGPVDTEDVAQVNMAAEEGVVRSIRSDISSAPGLSGAAVVDLRTGKVLGMHYGGRWQEGKGKFAYAYAIADLVALPDLPEAVQRMLNVAAHAPGTAARSASPALE